jgi:hypothetical protein
LGMITPSERQQLGLAVQRQWTLRVLPLLRRKPRE